MILHGLTWEDTTTDEALERIVGMSSPADAGANPSPHGVQMASQLDERYGDVKRAIDEFRDAILEAGPDPAGHREIMKEVGRAHPDFFFDATFALAAYTNDQPGEVDAETEAAVTELYSAHKDVVVTAHDLGAARLATSIEALGISLRITGKGGK